MTFSNKTMAGFGIGLALLACVSVLAYRGLARNRDDRLWLMHTHVVIEKIDDVEISLTDAETGQRGYILTGNAAYLTPYNQALDHIHENMKQLRELTADNLVQQRTMDLVERLAALRLKEFYDRIAMRDTDGLEATIANMRAGSGLPRMMQLRAQLASMRAEESRLLLQRSEELDISSQAVRVVVVVGYVLALFSLLFAAIAVRQEMVNRQRAEEAVRELNAGLERRVSERTAELAERAKELARSNSELQQFAYVASHDLQEPLRMVASFTQLLAKRYSSKLDDDARDFINFAVDGATRMQTLITDLLSYSRVGSQGHALEKTSCDAVLDLVLHNLQPAIADAGATIVRGALPEVMADSHQMVQLFQNLIANAIKFHGTDAPRVEVRAERNGRDWIFTVRDNGIGISQQHTERIFVIFQRLHGKTEYPGTGIGLAVCKKIVERHGGRIWVQSAPGEGCTFCFTLPAQMKFQTEREEQHDGSHVPVSAG